MAGKRKSDAKDPATKNTFNPPNKEQRSKYHGEDTQERDVGQFTGEGEPGLQKK